MRVEKLQSLQNVFVVVEFEAGENYSVLAQRLCLAKSGLGADGLIAIQNDVGGLPKTFFFNADGSKAALCGNGLRCAAYWYVLRGQKNRRFCILTEDGEKQILVKNQKPFVAEVNLGSAEFFAGDLLVDEPVLSKISVKGKSVFLFKTRLGVPHAVLIDQNELQDFAEDICVNSAFDGGTNVDFVTTMGNGEIFVKTFERGVGWTASCGTGGGASVAVCLATGRCRERVKVIYDGGTAFVSAKEDGVWVEAVAQRAFCGEMFLGEDGE